MLLSSKCATCLTEVIARPLPQLLGNILKMTAVHVHASQQMDTAAAVCVYVQLTCMMTKAAEWNTYTILTPAVTVYPMPVPTKLTY